MNIGFDAKRAFHNGSGLGNYSRNLLRSLAVYHPEDHYHLYDQSPSEARFFDANSGGSSFLVHAPVGFGRSFKGLWRSFGITESLNTDGIDIYHGLSNELPFNINRFRGKKVVTVHDLIFIRYPALYAGFDRAFYHAKVNQACSDADVVVAISEQTKKDLMEYMDVPASKIRVVYQSCDASFFSQSDEETKERVRLHHNLPDTFLLYVGTIEERKNLMLIMDALARGIDIPLVVVGKKKAYYQQVIQRVQALGLETRVVFLDAVSDADLPSIFQMAHAFIYPSRFEGFGIPIIEALASKTPVITTFGGVFPEAGGPSSLYIHPDRPLELVEAVRRLSSDSSFRAETIAEGAAYVERFRPEHTSAVMHALYKSLV